MVGLLPLDTHTAIGLFYNTYYYCCPSCIVIEAMPMEVHVKIQTKVLAEGYNGVSTPEASFISSCTYAIIQGPKNLLRCVISFLFVPTPGLCAHKMQQASSKHQPPI